MDLLEDFFNQYRYWIILALFIWFFLLWLTRWIRFEKKHWNSTALERYVDKSFPDNYEDEFYNPFKGKVSIQLHFLIKLKAQNY